MGVLLTLAPSCLHEVRSSALPCPSATTDCLTAGQKATEPCKPGLIPSLEALPPSISLVLITMIKCAALSANCETKNPMAHTLKAWKGSRFCPRSLYSCLTTNSHTFLFRTPQDVCYPKHHGRKCGLNMECPHRLKCSAPGPQLMMLFW